MTETNNIYNKKLKEMDKITVGTGTDEQRDIEVLNFIQIEETSGRDVKVIQLANEEGFLMVASNPKDSDRCSYQEMWLSVETYTLMCFCLNSINIATALDFDSFLKSNEINVNCSELVNMKMFIKP